MVKKLVLVLLFIVLCSFVSAYVPQDQQRAVEQFKTKYNFSDVVFSDSDLKTNALAYYEYSYKVKSNKIVSERIVILPLSQKITISEFMCLLEHEYGHRVEALTGSRDNKLSEKFADDYMQSVYHVCERWY